MLILSCIAENRIKSIWLVRLPSEIGLSWEYRLTVYNSNSNIVTNFDMFNIVCNCISFGIYIKPTPSNVANSFHFIACSSVRSNHQFKDYQILFFAKQTNLHCCISNGLFSGSGNCICATKFKYQWINLCY